MPLLCWVCCLLMLPTPLQALCSWVGMVFLFSHTLVSRRRTAWSPDQGAADLPCPRCSLSILRALFPSCCPGILSPWHWPDLAQQQPGCPWAALPLYVVIWIHFHAPPLLTVHTPSPASSPGLCCQGGFRLSDHRLPPPALRSPPASVDPAFGPSALISLHVGSSSGSIAELDSVPKPCTSFPMVASGTAGWCRDSQGHSRAGHVLNGQTPLVLMGWMAATSKGRGNIFFADGKKNRLSIKRLRCHRRLVYITEQTPMF